MHHCTVNKDVIPWVVALVTSNVVCCVFGAVGSTCCMWCLYHCQRTKVAMKIQLMWLFSLIICSVITLPMVCFITYNDHQCHFSYSPETRFWFVAINSMVQQMGRATLSSIAFFRMVAVCWAEKFMKWARPKVVVTVQMLLFPYTLLIWLAQGGHKGFQLPAVDSTAYYYGFYGSTSIISLFAVPFLVTFITSAIMISRLRQKDQFLGSDNGTHVDHVVHSTTLIIIISLFADCPHLIIHLCSSKGIALIIIHMINNTYLVLIPIIFLASNSSYRQVLSGLFHERVLKVSQWVSKQPSNSTVFYCDSLEMQSTRMNTNVAK